MIKTHRAIALERIRLLIFDLDGTLIDSRRDLANSVNAMLRHYGRRELPQEVIAGYIGDGAPMLVRRSLGDPEDSGFVQEALEYFLSYYRDHKLDHTYVYQGIKEALETLRFNRDPDGRATERTMAVLTNKPVGASRAIVQALGLGQFFFQIYGGNSFGTKKPDPEGVHKLMQEAGAAAEETMLIGDSDVDVLTARNAGIWSCGVSYGFAPHTLETAPPDVLVDSPEELAAVFVTTEARRH